MLTARVLTLLCVAALCAGCGTYQANRDIERLTLTESWQPKGGVTPKRQVHYAVGHCYVKYVDGRERTNFNKELIFDAFRGCMADNGYVEVAGR